MPDLWGIAATAVPYFPLGQLRRRRRGAARALAIVTMLVGLAGFGLVARAANLGGEIRHPEIRAGFVPPPPPPRPAGAPREGGK